jgi:hypothetical protein
MSETMSESSDRDDQQEQPPVDDSVRCSGCETTRQWTSFDDSPEDVDAIGTCPDCGTHIIGFETITDDDREEWGKSPLSLTDCTVSDDHTNGEISS